MSDRLNQPIVIELRGSITPEMLSVGASAQEKQRLISSILLTIQIYQIAGEYPIEPHPEIELKDAYCNIIAFMEEWEATGWNPVNLISFIDNCSAQDLLILQGMRITEGTLFDEPFFPDLNRLYELAIEPYNEYLTKISRARSKHAHRCQEHYWGEISGSPGEQNQKAEQLITELFHSYSWWNRFAHFKHDVILEFRDRTGHGMRWSISQDTFLGLVEPIDPNLGKIF